MNWLKLIAQGLGLLGRLSGLKPGPDIKPLERKPPPPKSCDWCGEPVNATTPKADYCGACARWMKPS